jgi:tRNA (Thr-GGU) A37 N-methylase
MPGQTFDPKKSSSAANKRKEILQVHPRGNPENPLRGVFATRAPVRPNLIAISRCRVLSVEGRVIAIDDIDAFPDTPVLDIKPYDLGSGT